MPQDIHTTESERRGDVRIMFDYLHKLSTTVMLGILAWAGVSINQGNTNIALLTQRVEQLGKQLEALISDKYTAAEATRDLALRDQRIGSLEDRIARMEDLTHRGK